MIIFNPSLINSWLKRRFLATSSPCMSFLLTLLQTTLRRNPWRMLERNLKICLDKCTMRSLKRRISGTVMQQCNLNVTNIQTISTKSLLDEKDLEMFYLNTIEQLFLFVEQLDQLEVYLPYSILLTGIPMLVVFQNLRWNSNKTSLFQFFNCSMIYIEDRNFEYCKLPLWLLVVKRSDSDSIFATLNRKSLAIERMIIEGCDILLDVNQVFVRQGTLIQVIKISIKEHNLGFE